MVVIIKIRNQMAPERNLVQDDDMVEVFSPLRPEAGENDPQNPI